MGGASGPVRSCCLPSEAPPSVWLSGSCCPAVVREGPSWSFFTTASVLPGLQTPPPPPPRFPGWAPAFPPHLRPRAADRTSQGCQASFSVLCRSVPEGLPWGQTLGDGGVGAPPAFWPRLAGFCRRKQTLRQPRAWLRCGVSTARSQLTGVHLPSRLCRALAVTSEVRGHTTDTVLSADQEERSLWLDVEARWGLGSLLWPVPEQVGRGGGPRSSEGWWLEGGCLSWAGRALLHTWGGWGGVSIPEGLCRVTDPCWAPLWRPEGAPHMAEGPCSPLPPALVREPTGAWAALAGRWALGAHTSGSQAGQSDRPRREASPPSPLFAFPHCRATSVKRGPAGKSGAAGLRPAQALGRALSLRGPRARPGEALGLQSSAQQSPRPARGRERAEVCSRRVPSHDPGAEVAVGSIPSFPGHPMLCFFF